MDTTRELRQTLRTHGQSLTSARQTVFAALQHQEPLTMRELVARCPGIDRASVYRTVTLFEKLGVIERLQTGWKYRLELSGNYHEHHHHATCLRCGRSLVIQEDETVERYVASVASELGFTLTGHQLELQGYCTDCQSKAKV